MWFIDRFEAGNVYETSPIYHNIPLIFHIKGIINREILEKSIKTVIDRHRALRTRVITRDSQPVQVIDNEVEFKLENLEITNREGENPENPEKRATEIAIAFAKQPFTLDSGPLIRAQLIRYSPADILLALSVHHIISDRYSLRIIGREIFTHYTAILSGETPALPALSFHYPDFSQWQHGFSDEVLEPIIYYWKKKLHGKLQPLELPTDSPRAAIHVFHDGIREFEINSHLYAKIGEFCRKHKTHRFLPLLAAFKILLYRYSGQTEIVVGTTHENREQPGLEHIVGPISNLLVLRSFLEGTSDFLNVLEHLEETLAEAGKYKDIPFERLDLELKPAKDMSRLAFFDVLIQYEDNPLDVVSKANPAVNVVETNLGWGKYDFNILLREGTDAIRGSLVYNSDYYCDTTVTRFIDHYRELLESLLQDPAKEISRHAILTGEERRRILEEWNRTGVHYPHDKTIHQLFEEQVEKTPAKIALIDPGSDEQGAVTAGSAVTETGIQAGKHQRLELTYQELNRQANRQAHYLRKNVNMAPEMIAGIMMKPGIHLITGMLGILKAGGAYLPLDYSHPEQRIVSILEDSQAPVLLTAASDIKGTAFLPDARQGEKNQTGSERSIIWVDQWREQLAAEPDDNPRHTNRPGDLAYIIYTSGTTGKPKGVMIEHRNVVRLLFNDAIQFDFDHNDTWTMFHSYCFDFSVWEMYGALLYGGKLVMIPKMTARDTAMFRERLREENVTVLNQTPTAFYRLMEEEMKQNREPLAIRYIIFGGEALNPGRLKEWKARYPGTRLINMYGTSETTVHVTYKEITETEIDLAVSNIGKPIPTLTGYVLDKEMNLVPVGVAGELYVGGEGVGRGYLNRPHLTDEKFITRKPGIKNQKLYRTGDLVKLAENGDMIYLDRIDNQVKIRGHRIELGEIENRILAYYVTKEFNNRVIPIHLVKNVVVIVRQNKGGDKYLCAYFVMNPSLPPDIHHNFIQSPSRTLKDHLAGTLPDYMIPSFFVMLDHIPLTDSGKVNRNALPEPEIDSGDEFIAPRNEVERAIAHILRDVLGIDYVKISVRANLFDLGVNSISLAKIAHRISTELNTHIQISTLFTKPTIELIVEDIQKNYTPSDKKQPVLLNRGNAPRNMFLLSGDGVVFGMKALARALEGHFNVYGIQARGIMDTGSLPETREEIYEEYYQEIKMVQANGPYVIGGHCFGAVISYELARTMEDRGDTVEKVIFFDEFAIMNPFNLDHMIYNKIYCIKEKVNRFFKTLLRNKKGKIQKEKTVGLAENLEARRLEVQSNFRRLYGDVRHFWRIIDTPMLIFKATRTDNPDCINWRQEVISRISTQPVVVIETPGDHFTIFDTPNVEVMARHIVEKI